MFSFLNNSNKKLLKSYLFFFCHTLDRSLLDPIARFPIFPHARPVKSWLSKRCSGEGTARIPRFRVLTFKVITFAGTRTSFVSRILIEHRHGRASLYTRVSRVSWRLSVSRPSIPFPFSCSDSNPADRYQGSLEPTAGKAVHGRPYRWIIIMHEFREPVARVCWRLAGYVIGRESFLKRALLTRVNPEIGYARWWRWRGVRIISGGLPGKRERVGRWIFWG